MTVDTTLKNTQQHKMLKVQKLRNIEHYDMQSVYDKLHEEACGNKAFNDLMPTISCENNILLAYRNIKNNKGSATEGTDGRTIEHYKEWDNDRFVKYFQGKLRLT